MNLLTQALVLVVLATSAAIVTPLTPRFPADTDGPILQASRATADANNSGVDLVWVAGSSDKIAYIDRCQSLTISVKPRLLHESIEAFWLNNSLTLEFTCVYWAANYSRKILSRISRSSFSNLTDSAGLSIYPCNDTDLQLRLMKQRTMDFLITANCSSPVGSEMVLPIEDAPRLSLRVFVNFSKAENERASYLYSGSLRFVYLDKIPAVLQLASMPIVTSSAVDVLKNLIDQKTRISRRNVVRAKFFTVHFMRLISFLPMYLRLAHQRGAVLTTSESCQAFNASNSIRITTDESAVNTLVLKSRENSTDAVNDTLICKDANFFYIDQRTGELYLLTAGFHTALAQLLRKSQSGDSPVSLRLCETQHFYGHTSRRGTSREVFYLRVSPTNLLRPVKSMCRAIGEFELVDLSLQVLHTGKSAVDILCPLVCSNPCRVSCAFDVYSNLTEVARFTCRADNCSAPFTVQVQATRTARFLSTLPPVLYAMEGEPLTYNCSAIVSSSSIEAGQITNSTTTAVFTSFRVPEQNKKTWSEASGWRFRPVRKPNRLESGRNDSRGDPIFGQLTESWSRETTSDGVVVETVTVIIPAVPPATDSGNFTHQFSCQLRTDPDVSNRLFGVHEVITSEVGADVVFVPRPTDESFTARILNETSVQFELQPLYVDYLGAAGARLASGFRLGQQWLTDQHPLVALGLLAVEFKESDGAVLLSVAKSWPPQHRPVGPQQLTAVFSFRYPGIGDQSWQDSAERCRADPGCFYSTDFDSELESVLRVTMDLGH